MIRTSHYEPVYRKVIREAFDTAIQNRHFWILAFFASVLTSAGIYDVLWNASTQITIQGSQLAKSFGGAVIHAATLSGGMTLERVIRIIGSFELLAIIALVIIFIGILSCVGQGALIHAIGARTRGRKPTLRESLQVGGHALWPVVVLNILVILTIWVLRFLGSLPLFYVIQHPGSAAYFVHIASFSLSLLLIFFVAVIEIFALNALILQGASLSDAISRGWKLLKQNWIVVIETAVLQVILAFSIWFLFMIVFAIAIMPMYIFLLSAAIMNSKIVFDIALLVSGIIFIGGFFTLIAFTILFQYATWVHLYRRLGEGGVVPKIHRWLRSATGSFPIKQS